MSREAMWSRLSAEKDTYALSKRMSWRIAIGGKNSIDSGISNAELHIIQGELVDEDELNRRALRESVRHFESHPEFRLNFRRVIGKKASYSGQLELFPLIRLEVGRKLSEDEFREVSGALKTLIRYYEGKVS